MLNILNRFCIAASCVTSLPLVGRDENDVCEPGLAKYLPSVGLLIGGILVGVSVTLRTVGVEPNVVDAVLLVIAWLVLSGGIHFDGLMDTADGIFSHRSPERMLEIMRDSRVGNFGVMTGVCVILLKIVGLLGVLNQGSSVLIAALLLIPAWSRWCEMFAIGSFPYARQEGMGKIWHDTTRTPNDLILGAILPAVATALCVINAGMAPLVVSLCTIAAGLSASFYLASIIKGHTGDTYGAVVELSETLGLLLLILLQRLI